MEGGPNEEPWPRVDPTPLVARWYHAEVAKGRDPRDVLLDMWEYGTLHIARVIEARVEEGDESGYKMAARWCRIQEQFLDELRRGPEVYT